MIVGLEPMAPKPRLGPNQYHAHVHKLTSFPVRAESRDGIIANDFFHIVRQKVREFPSKLDTAI